MKQLFAVLAVFTLAAPITGQTLTSLGPLRIGKTTPAVVDSIARVYGASASVAESPCAHVQVFELERVMVGDVPMHDVRLFFYDGMLAKVRFDYSPAFDAMMLGTYGEPKPSAFQYTGECRREPNVSHSRTWDGYTGTHRFMVIETSLRVYSAECAESTHRFYSMYSKILSDLIDECERAAVE